MEISCTAALQEMKLHAEQGRNVGMGQVWGQAGGEKVSGAEQRLSGVEATL